MLPVVPVTLPHVPALPALPLLASGVAGRGMPGGEVEPHESAPLPLSLPQGCAPPTAAVSVPAGMPHDSMLPPPPPAAPPTLDMPQGWVLLSPAPPTSALPHDCGPLLPQASLAPESPLPLPPEIPSNMSMSSNSSPPSPPNRAARLLACTTCTAPAPAPSASSPTPPTAWRLGTELVAGAGAKGWVGKVIWVEGWEEATRSTS